MVKNIVLTRCKFLFFTIVLYASENLAVERRTWTENEDALLSIAVSKCKHNGKVKWACVAEKLIKKGVDKNYKKCRERWIEHLDPNIAKDNFLPFEIEIIRNHIDSGWVNICTILNEERGRKNLNGHRTPNRVKNKANSIKRKRSAQDEYYETKRRKISVPDNLIEEAESTETLESSDNSEQEAVPVHIPNNLKWIMEQQRSFSFSWFDDYSFFNPYFFEEHSLEYSDPLQLTE